MNEQELEQMHRDVAEISDLAEGIREILGLIGDGLSEAVVLELALKRIIDIADKYC